MRPGRGRLRPAPATSDPARCEGRHPLLVCVRPITEDGSRRAPCGRNRARLQQQEGGSEPARAGVGESRRQRVRRDASAWPSLTTRSHARTGPAFEASARSRNQKNNGSVPPIPNSSVMTMKRHAPASPMRRDSWHHRHAAGECRCEAHRAERLAPVRVANSSAVCARRIRPEEDVARSHGLHDHRNSWREKADNGQNEIDRGD